MAEPTPEAYEAAARDFSNHKIVTSWLLGSAKWECSCGASEQGREYYAHLNASVVDAVWDLAEATVRAKIAAEIRAAKPDVVLLTGHPFGEDERMITLDRAARIAEGKGDETP